MKSKPLILIAVAALSLIGATSNYATADLRVAALTDQTQPVPDATYTGDIAGGGTVDFDVSPDADSVTRFRASDVPGRHVLGTCTSTWVATGNFPITDNTFELSGIQTITRFEFTGTFPAVQRAQGTVEVNDLNCYSDSLTWTATTATPMPAAQTITFPALPDTRINAGPVPLRATASSGLPVTYTSNTPAVCTTSGAQADLKAVGTCSITARQPGSNHFLAAAPARRSFSVMPKRTVTVKVRAQAHRSKLFVNVDPNLTDGRHWKFQVQAKAHGRWITLAKTYQTKGEEQTRTLNLAKGEYRVKVESRYGFAGTTSTAAQLRR